MRVFLSALLVLSFSAFGHGANATEEFDNIAGVKYGMSPIEVSKVLEAKDWVANVATSVINRVEFEELDWDKLRIIRTQDVEILGAKWELQFVFFDKKSKESGSNAVPSTAKIIGFRLSLREIANKIWVTEKHGNASFKKVIGALKSKYGLSANGLEFFDQISDVGKIVKGKMGYSTVIFVKTEPNTFINKLTRRTNQTAKNKSPTWWTYSVEIFASVKGGGKKTDL